MKSGDKYGMLTLIEKTTRPEGKNPRGTWWLCQCDCGEKRDEAIRKDCELRPNRFAPKNAVMKYCKSCRNGNSLEFCGCEETCPLYKFMPAIIQEVADKIRGK